MVKTQLVFSYNNSNANFVTYNDLNQEHATKHENRTKARCAH